MPQEEQNEWPSFDAVLRDVALSDVARRTRTAIATSRRALANVDAASDENRDEPASSRVRPPRASDNLQTADDDPEFEPPDQSTATEDAFSLDLLPAPLPPLELDTTAVRALLEPLGAGIEGLDFELKAVKSDAFDGDEQSDDDVHQLHQGETDLDPFDSVRTTNEIDGNLSEFFTFDTDFAEPATGNLESDLFDNVVPIRPVPESSAVDEAHWATELPNEPRQAIETQPVVEAKHTGGPGLNNTPETSHEDDDPWAYMRPTEGAGAKHLWAKLPKFFGGDERKRRKAERRDTATHAAKTEDRGEAELEIAFDSECPNCGSECQVDLDDPIGRRVHVSCPSCDHMWFTPYIIGSQAG